MQERYKMLTLQLAAIYNIVWSAWVIIFPSHFFEVLNMPPINYPMIWQGLGMVIGVYGFGYWWAAKDPSRHWPIVAVGLLGKIFGPLGYIFNIIQGFPYDQFGYTLITNDIIWWIPFYLILKDAWKDGKVQLW